MSRRRTRSRLVDSEEDEEQDVAAARPPKASRRPALQLSQSSGAGGCSAASALATLLGTSKPPPAPEAKGRAAAGAAVRGPSRGRAASQRAAPNKVGPPAATVSAAGAGAPPRAADQQAADHGGSRAGQVWVDKHAPKSEAELVVHKKKVQEVREWLEQQRASLGQPGVRRLLVVTGPPGCGKSTVLSVLAASLGFDVSEWRPPSAVGWEEAQHAGMQRRSKLEEFGEFVARAKMPHLSLTSSSSREAASSGKATAAGPGSAWGSQPAAARGSSQAAAAAAAAGAGGGGGEGSQGTCGSQSQRRGRLAPSLLPTLVVVDDLPHASGPQQRQQVAEALGDLAAGARFPVVVVATETSGKAQQERGLSAAAGTYQGLHKDLIAVLESHGAATVAFNPVTTLNTAKALQSILDRERRSLPDADVEAIAEQANGDLHNAISTLQFVCTGAAAAATVAPKGRGRGTKRKAGGGSKERGSSQQQESNVAFALRDSTLSLFHALGKLLYNKRLPGPAAATVLVHQGQQPGSGSLPPPSQQPSLHQQQQQQQQSQQQAPSQAAPAGRRPSSSQQQAWTANGFWQSAAVAAGGGGSGSAGGSPAPPRLLAGWAQRQQMEFDPEAVLAAAGLEAGSVAAFLHENVLHFIEDDAIADAAGCLEQLSAADALASSRRWGTSDALLMGDDDTAGATLADATSASVAARGVCFHNTHPAPRRFLPLKAPSLFAVAKGAAANGAELSAGTAAAWAARSGLGCLQPAGHLAAELLPYLRIIAARSQDPSLQLLQPTRWTRYWGGHLYDQQQRQGGGGREGVAGGLLEADGGEVAVEEVEDYIEESEEDW